MTVLKPSANLFALLDGDDPGDSAAAKVDAAARPPMNINKKQQPEPSIWKLKAIEANAAKKKMKKPQQPVAASKPRPNAAPMISGKKQPQPAAHRAYKASTASYAAANKQQQQQPAPVENLAAELFGRAYPSARYLIYINRKPQNGADNAKDGVADSASTDDDKKGGQDGARQKKGGQVNGAAVNKAPVPVPPPAKVEPPAPVKPVLPLPPPPSLKDLEAVPGPKVVRILLRVSQ